MTIINTFLILTLSLSPLALAQLPSFLHRFRPVRHRLFSSGSSSNPSSLVSTLFPLSTSSSILTPTYGPPPNFLLSSSSLSSPYSSAGLGSLNSGLGSLTSGLGSSAYTASASSLSPHFSMSASSLGSGLFESPSLSSPSYTSFSQFSGLPSSSSQFSGSPSFSSAQLSGSPSFSSSQLSGSPSFSSSHLSGSPSFGSNLFSGLSNFGSTHYSESPTFGSTQYSGSSNLGGLNSLKFSPSSLSHSLSDLSAGYGAFDQSELIDDYPGFSNEGFAKDLNFAGSETIKFQVPAPSHYNNEYVYLRSNDDKK